MGEGAFWHLRTTRSGSNLIPVVWPDGDTDAGFTNPFRAGIRPSFWLDPSDTEDAEKPETQDANQSTNLEADQPTDNDEEYDGDINGSTGSNEGGSISASGNDILKDLDLDN